jgi:hypothetical protein
MIKDLRALALQLWLINILKQMLRG